MAARGLQEWVEFLLAAPGEKLDLSSIALYHPELSEVIDKPDMERSFFWSGQLEGPPDILENIIQTQRYDLAPENVMPISGGTSMGIFLACEALLQSGDEVITETPGWPQVPAICGEMGITVRAWHLRAKDGWQPDTAALQELVTPKTRLIYINHPHNPTGSVISEEKMAEICDIASRHGAYILSDEINRGLEWNSDEPSPSAANIYERAISTASMSKSFGATGLRYGWFATRDKDLYRKCYNIYYNSMLCNNHPSEIIAREMLKPGRYSQLMEKSKEVGKRNLAVLSDMIERNDSWSLVAPGGSFSCFPRYDTGEPSWDFFERMLTRKPIGLEFVPGSCFSEECEYHIRIGLGSRPEHFREALALLEEGAREYKD